MRKVIYHTQTTVDGRIAREDGELWEPFPWGETEIAYVNGFFRATDTWILGRQMHDVIVPWWSQVAAGNPPEQAGDLGAASLDFGQIFGGLRIAVFSRTLDDGPGRTVLRGDPVEQLAALKREDGRDIMLSCGPALLGQVAPLVDEYLLAVSPVVLAGGKRIFDDLQRDIPLRLAHAEVFDGGAIVLRYQVQQADP
jgi:dihydrofolate reductase